MTRKFEIEKERKGGGRAAQQGYGKVLEVRKGVQTRPAVSFVVL